MLILAAVLTASVLAEEVGEYGETAKVAALRSAFCSKQKSRRKCQRTGCFWNKDNDGGKPGCEPPSQLKLCNSFTKLKSKADKTKCWDRSFGACRMDDANE